VGGSLTTWLPETLSAERERWLLWLPVAFGFGAALYFALPEEPRPLSGLIAAALLLGPVIVWRQRPVLFVALLALLTASLGFAAAQWRSERVAAPLLTERFGPAEIVGRIEELERLGAAARLTLTPLAIEGLAAEQLPGLVRLRVAQPPEAALPGAVVRLRGVLLPPPPPAMPGGYDFAREAWFRGLGAVGFAFGALTLEQDAAAASGWSLFWSRLRSVIGLELRRELEGDVAAVAEALLTGERAAISEPLLQAYRDSGLAHLLSISGLHISLVAGLFFFTLRAALAAVPALALSFPIKKWAAAAGLAVLPFYTFLVGASVPTLRASIMLMLVLLAVLLDRRAISLRLVAWAALVVLALAPEALLGPSFQMSFAAVTALIAAYELWRDSPGAREERGPLGRVWLYVAGVFFSSLVATLATAPFALFHFDRLALYGLVANLIAVPLTAFWVMPACLLVYLLLPFGLAHLPFQLLGWGVAAINLTAEAVASWPGASLLLPAMPLWGLTAATLGGLWLCLWRRAWRLAGVLGLLVAFASPFLVRPPDILVSGDARVLALADPAGRLWLSSVRAQRFTSAEWLERRGQTEAELWSRAPAEALAGWLACDALGCRYRRAGRSVAIVFAGTALLEDCWGSDLVLAILPVRRACPREAAVIDRFDLWREGTHAFWVEEEGLRWESVADWRGRRPWSPRRTGEPVAVPDARADAE